LFVVVIIGASILFLAVFVYFFAPVYVYLITVKRKTPQLPFFRGGEAEEIPEWLPESSWLEAGMGESAGIVSRDGLKLWAYYLPCGGKARGTAILAHGYTRDGRILGAEARFFRDDLKFNVLLPDARGHGRSEGSYCGFGWFERLDYLDWIDWALRRARSDGTDPGIVLYGVSMGAATVMMTAGENPPAVKAVIEDCGYSSLEDEMRSQVGRYYHFVTEWLLKAAGAYNKKKTGYSFAEVSVIDKVRKIQIPTLFIHGDADNYVPCAMVHSLYEACTAPKDIFIVKGAAHAMAYQTDPGAYEKKIREFLEKCL
jgi:fermentation-respiration switch protein FrsA (DUF1100 family)